MNEKAMNVVIVGGSLAGLMHGIMLKRLGYSVHILEQSPASILHGQAAGIRAGEELQEFFQTYDMLKEPYYLDCPGLQFIDRDSKNIRFVKFPMAMTSWTTLYYRLRANFDGFTSKHCPKPPGSVTTDGTAIYDVGKRVTDVKHRNGQVQIMFDDTIHGRSGSLDADLVIAADGSNSALRRILLPELQRSYAGYTIPGPTGSLEPGERIFNFVWYSNCPSSSSKYTAIMTDNDGHHHRNTLPPGKMSPKVWHEQVSYAQSVLARPFAELVRKTTQPFISSVCDIIAPRASFLDGKLLLVGEALALFRPHVALSANQAAMNCLLLKKALQGEITMKEWERRVLQYGARTRLLSILTGTWTQFGGMQLVISAVEYGLLLVRQRVENLWVGIFG